MQLFWTGAETEGNGREPCPVEQEEAIGPLMEPLWDEVCVCVCVSDWGYWVLYDPRPRLHTLSLPLALFIFISPRKKKEKEEKKKKKKKRTARASCSFFFFLSFLLLPYYLLVSFQWVHEATISEYQYSTTERNKLPVTVRWVIRGWKEEKWQVKLQFLA